MNKIKTTDKIKTNWPVMILLILGLSTIVFPPVYGDCHCV